VSGVGIIIELRVKLECEERFVVATRLYGLRTRTETSTQRFEILKRRDAACDFVISVLFRNDAALEAHVAAPHTRDWIGTVKEFVEGEVSVRRVQPLVNELLPPLPRPPYRPALETATRLPSRRAEASGWPTAAVSRPSSPPGHCQALPLLLPRIEVSLHRLEIASAHEGPLRGQADPCFLVGVYKLDGDRAEMLGRAIYRFTLAAAPPCELVRSDRLLDLPVFAEGFPVRVGVIVLAFEENGGSDIRAAYQDLGDPEQLSVWPTRQAEPDPVRLGPYSARTAVNRPERVNLLRDGEALGKSHDDAWVGAAIAAVEFAKQGDERLVRYHTVSDDGRNDWHSEFGLHFG
jgi:quinol monooxygenase YgiN